MTKTLPASLRPYNSKREDRINKRYNKGDSGAEETACICCGRKAAGTHFAYITNMCVFSSTPREESDDIGFERVGSHCAKALRAHGVKVWTRKALMARK